MQIRRVDCYDDHNFSPKVLAQHGAFYVDGNPCAFEIIGPNCAKIDFHDYSCVEEIIDEFRFYAGHISMFYDMAGNLLARRKAAAMIDISIDFIQPSQFYVDERKLEAVSTFVRSERDVIVPLVRWKDRLMAMDGHTRLYCAKQMGIERVCGFMDEENEDIFFFAEEAERRGIFTVGDMQLLSHEEYERKWHRFCDDFFAEKRKDG